MYSGRHANFVVKQLPLSLIGWRAKVVWGNGGRMNPLASMHVARAFDLLNFWTFGSNFRFATRFIIYIIFLFDH